MLIATDGGPGPPVAPPLAASHVTFQGRLQRRPLICNGSGCHSPLQSSPKPTATRRGWSKRAAVRSTWLVCRETSKFCDQVGFPRRVTFSGKWRLIAAVNGQPWRLSTFERCRRDATRSVLPHFPCYHYAYSSRTSLNCLQKVADCKLEYAVPVANDLSGGFPKEINILRSGKWNGSTGSAGEPRVRPDATQSQRSRAECGPDPNLDPVCRAYKHLFSNGI